MKTLIITAAGLSTRFEGLKPKWMLTHPKGNWMLVEALKGINFNNVDRICFGFSKQQVELHNCYDAINMCIDQLGIQDKTDVVFLEKQTRNQPETVYQVIKQLDVKGQIIIKEVDNYFKCNIEEGNYMCYYDLNNTTKINPSNKSYITIKHNLITDIVEKKVVSSTFGCGSYSFAFAYEYCQYFEALKNIDKLFLSDIIKRMIIDGIEFKPCEVKDYIDWGTKQDWFEYVRNYKTLFIDLDGTLVKSSGKHTPPYWGETKAIKENVDFINKLYDTGKVYIIITTARDKEAKEITLKQLKREGIKYHDIILGLYHSNRTIINDYGTSSPYPTCDAVNIIRNSNELERFLKDLGE